MSKMKRGFSFKGRLRFLVFALFLLGGIVIWRLFTIQVIEHEDWSAKADRQHFSSYHKAPISVRGDIYFKEKDGTLISAATLKNGYVLAAKPSFVKDPVSLCKEINQIISLDQEDCVKRAGKKDDPYEELIHHISYKDSQKITDLKLEGLVLSPEAWRFYPASSLASQVLGFVGYQGDKLVGRYGVEQNYEDVLRGAKEELREGDSFATMFFDLGKDLFSSDKDHGHDLTLTLEPRVQNLLEEKLSALMLDWKAKSAGGIIMDPQSGAILAMANKPSFNPNNYFQADPDSFGNPLISGVFEMGSVMKPLTMAAAIDSGSLTENTTYNDKGFVVLNGRRIENYDGKARGTVDMQTVLSQSLNTGAIFAMQQMGQDVFLEYIKKYGLHSVTGIDLPVEIGGKINNLSSGREVEFATASFGHGIAMSPISFASAVASLANGGLLLKPYVVSEVMLGEDKSRQTQVVSRGRSIKEETSEKISRMLVKVFDDALLGGTVKMEHYSLAAKTGTALLNKKGGGYYEDRYFHTFFGYGPAFDAKFLVFLYLQDPQGVKYASHTLTHPFMDLIKFLLNYYEVPPDR